MPKKPKSRRRPKREPAKKPSRYLPEPVNFPSLWLPGVKDFEKMRDDPTLDPVFHFLARYVLEPPPASFGLLRYRRERKSSAQHKPTIRLPQFRDWHALYYQGTEHQAKLPTGVDASRASVDDPAPLRHWSHASGGLFNVAAFLHAYECHCRDIEAGWHWALYARSLPEVFRLWVADKVLGIVYGSLDGTRLADYFDPEGKPEDPTPLYDYFEAFDKLWLAFIF